jgi:hypothetical protein
MDYVSWYWPFDILTNRAASTRNLQNIKDKYADQLTETSSSLSHPRIASLEPPWLKTTRRQNCMYMQNVLNSVVECII